MTVHHRKKASRYRGSKTHGCGSKKKRRGAGNRGGRGMAGCGKRAKTKKPSILQLFGNEYFGKHGFKRPGKIVINQKGINLAFLEEQFDHLLANGIIKKEGNLYSIDLSSLGANKLLGSGNVSHKWKITTDFASKGAADKVKEAGGEVVCENMPGDAEEAAEKE